MTRLQLVVLVAPRSAPSEDLEEHRAVLASGQGHQQTVSIGNQIEIADSPRCVAVQVEDGAGEAGLWVWRSRFQIIYPLVHDSQPTGAGGTGAV
ncbi:MAG: hypothetical protein BWY79_00894 [Actinobacteria bacterium ADurb.Bin444]|nr:MAG: hypothetical protein BWY79_00894 [Actinobacteria bacterium ADurb.Bin444]